MTSYKKLFNFFCQLLSVLWSGSETIIVMESAWFSAFLNGINNGSWTAIININSHGEAYSELILWCIMTPVIIYGGYLNLKLIYDSHVIEKDSP